MTAAAFDWSRVNPTIFGSLLEGVLGDDRRSEIGAHYTHEVDIMKIVGPTIVRPWRERINAASTPQQARDLLDELCRFKVLDPACGCGNFLYVAYRELRALEFDLKQLIRRLAESTGNPVPHGPVPYYPVTNLQGIDIEQTAVSLAKVVLWMGQRQLIDSYGEAEPPLPLQSLPGLVRADALRAEWPQTHCIVGNPPFLGAKFIRPQLGDAWADDIVRRFGVGVKDLCVYWFRRTADHLLVGQRAGLVGTNSVSQTLGRAASLEYITSDGGVITDAVSSQKWPGAARVHVSIVNWVKGPATPPTTFTLDGQHVASITTRLRIGDPTPDAGRLVANRNRAFAGVVPQGRGFVLDGEQARAMLADTTADYATVVRPYLKGDDLTSTSDQLPTRWIIDFTGRGLEAAEEYPAALSHLRSTVRAEREASLNRNVERRWWLFGRRVEGMREAVGNLHRFAVCASTGKRLVTAWATNPVVAMNTVYVFAFDDDYHWGFLTSRTHSAWAWAQTSTFETRLRYTAASVFETLPLPTPGAEQQTRVAEASRSLLARRTEICTTRQIGLTTLYNAVDEGAWTDLAALHRELDEAVADCYGWSRSVAQDDAEIVRRLTELNREIVQDGRPYAPFG